MTKQIPRLRVFVEGAIIVLSILVAFGVDAWWDGVQEREEEQGILLGLRIEFESHRAQLEARKLSNDTMVADMTLLLEVGDDPRPSLTIDVMDRVLRSTLNNSTWDPGTRDREALIFSGKLELIRHVGLRGALSGWGTVVDEVRDDEIAIRSFSQESLIPYVASKGGPIGRAWSTIMDWPAPVTPVPVAEALYQDLFTDPAFIGLAENQLAWRLSLVDEYVDAREAATQILELIEAEIGGTR